MFFGAVISCKVKIFLFAKSNDKD